MIRQAAAMAAAAVLLALQVGAVGAGGEAAGQPTATSRRSPPGGAFNLRVLSDSVPDFSSREDFVHSALSNWESDREKALAQFRWMHRCRRVGQFAPEDSRPALDPVLFFNSYGITYCSMVAQMNCSLWEAWGKPFRMIDLDGHVVSEVFYDGAWHLYDNDFCNYWLNEKGAVAGVYDLAGSRIHGNVEDLRPGEYYIFDHCPVASAPRGEIFMGPVAASVLWVARDWHPGPDKVWPRTGVSGAHAGHRYLLGLRPGESYTRHWLPLGTGDRFARLFRNGKDPAADGSYLRNSRSNGEWVWEPMVWDPGAIFDSENAEAGPAAGRPAVRAKDPARPSYAVYRVMAANVVTSAALEAETVGNVRFSVSGNGGVSWQAVPTKVGERGRQAALITDPVAGRLEYLVRAEWSGPETGLDALKLTTVTQVNPRTLPALRLGANAVVAVSDEHLEYLTFNPRLADGRHEKEVHETADFQSLEAPWDFEPSLRAVRRGRLVLRARAPRDIRHVRMAASAHMNEPSADIYLAVSFDGGATWRDLRKFVFSGALYDKRLEAETRDVPAGAREVLIRYTVESGDGLVNCFAQVGYEPAGAFAPYGVTYSWSEYRDGQWVERRHTEPVDRRFHAYTINVGGTRPPRMNWVRVAVPCPKEVGYSDGEDVGPGAGRQPHQLVLGRNLSPGCPYTVSRPASEAFPDAGSRLLTDGFAGVADYRGMAGINLSGEKNEKRVGQLVVWPAGGEVAVTLDLGEVKTAGGARIRAVQPNENVLYPSRMDVEVSEDGKRFERVGSAAWEDCFFPPADAVLWEGTDSPLYDHLPAGGILDFAFPVPFDRPTRARYVRFRLAPPERGPGRGPDAEKDAGMALWELEVYDDLRKVPWTDRVKLPREAD